ncbi:MAG: O-antigen ligase family protein, partial [bacterium]|nr:O-antigen ligase family protein [bacterium]
MASIYGIFEALGVLPSMAASYLPRASSVFGNPSFFSVFLILPFWFSVYLYIEDAKWRRFYLASTCLMFLGVLVSGTRGALVGLVVGLVVFVVIRYLSSHDISHKRLLSGALGAVLLFLTVFSYGFFFAPDRSLMHRVTHLSFGTSSQRINYWGMSLQGAFDAPVLGVGYENFSVIADRYFESEFYEIAGTWPDKPHNHLLEVLSVGGLLGVVLYFAFVFLLFQRASKHERRDVLFPAILAHFVAVFFLFESIVVWPMLFFLIALVDDQYLLKTPIRSRSVRILSTSGAVVLVLISFVSVLYPLHLQGVYAQRMHVDSVEAGYDLSAISPIYDLGSIAQMQTELMGHAYQLGDQRLDVWAVSSRNMHAEALVRHANQAQLYYEAAANLIHRVEYGIDEVVDPEALILLDRAQVLAPNRIEPMIAKARIYQLDGKLQEAIELTERVVDLAPTDPQGLSLLAGLYVEDGRTMDALPLM